MQLSKIFRKRLKKLYKFVFLCIEKGIRLIPIFFIRLYQITISPLIGRSCRFYPSCSHYAVEAFQKHGIFYGFWLMSKRLLKCAPWHPGGVDLVPEKLNTKVQEEIEESDDTE